MTYKGFTLAEVLITLGIIGIVAAMTIPNLLTKIQKIQIENQLKKSYALITNAIKLSEIDNGGMESWATFDDMGYNEFWTTYLLPYLKGARLCRTQIDCGYPKDMPAQQWSGAGWGMSTGFDRLLIQLVDGTVIFFPRISKNNDGKFVRSAVFYIDVNGNRRPNKYCLDFFMFIRDKEKGIYTTGCSASIQKNNWKFPSDYQYKF